MTADPTRRFSNRVRDYVRYRPSYPDAVITGLRDANILRPGAVVADIGSGTGLLTRLFLDAGHPVFGIEPNTDMRLAGEEQLRAYERFASLAGTAEATTLPDHSVDVVAAGQAFHWFDRAKTKCEFQRILRTENGGGSVVLVWNERRVGTSGFLGAYEKLLQNFATDYAAVDHRQMTPEIIAEFYSPAEVTMRSMEHRQVFDYEGLEGRLLSSSYAPARGEPRSAEMLAELRRIFDVHQMDGRVVLEYDTQVYVGKLVGGNDE